MWKHVNCLLLWHRRRVVALCVAVPYKFSHWNDLRAPQYGGTFAVIFNNMKVKAWNRQHIEANISGDVQVERFYR